MAKMSIKIRNPDYTLISQLHESEFDLGKHSKSSATFNAVPANDFEYRIVFEGSGFVYKNGELSAGTVTKITYEDMQGLDLAVIAGIKLNAKSMPDVGSGDLFFDPIFKGSDTIIGSREGDLIDGSRGNDKIKGGDGDDQIEAFLGTDTLTGGSGEDIFIISVNTKAIITDFDSIDDANGQDTLFLLGREPIDPQQIEQVGKDLVIDLGDGFTVRLLDLKAENFDPGSIVYEG